MTAYDKLIEIMNAHPDLIFSNDGYETLPKDIVAANQEAIARIEDILRPCIKGFVRFQNFKPRKDGTTAVRYQVHYNDEGSFTGVAYTDLDLFRFY